MADPGSLGDLECDDGQSQVGSAQQSEDPDIEPDREDLDLMDLLDCDPSLWPPVDPEFVPLVDELRTSIYFIKALRCASLDNGDLTEDALARLRHPQHVLEIEDPNELYSLKQYLATQNASQQTYHDIRGNHHDRFPALPMLSYAIISVVSVQPHEHRFEDGYERFFVWEQLGLDMALLEGQEEHSPEDE